MSTTLDVGIPGEGGPLKTGVLLKRLGARLVSRKNAQNVGGSTTSSPREKDGLALNDTLGGVEHELLAESRGSEEDGGESNGGEGLHR